MRTPSSGAPVPTDTNYGPVPGYVPPGEPTPSPYHFGIRPPGYEGSPVPTDIGHGPVPGYVPPPAIPIPSPYTLGNVSTIKNGGGTSGGGSGGGSGKDAAGSITVPGFTPDYQSLIEQDPYFAQIRDLLSAQSAADAANRDSQLGQAFINFGEAPEGYDNPVADAAHNNPFSVLSVLQQAHEQNLRAQRNQLAARGILQSGEYGYQLGQENKDYLQNQYEARQQLLDFINGVQSAFAQAEQNRNNQLVQAGQQAYQNQLGLPQNTPTNPFKANLGASWRGGAYYKGKDGKLYDAQGQALNVQNEIARLRDRLQHFRQQGYNWNRIRNTDAWSALQYLLGSK